MKFIYADALKQLFTVTGSFYQLSINRKRYNCRNKLEIKSTNYVGGCKPDVIVVMMNPGSSKPIDKNHTQPQYTATMIHDLVNPTLVKTKPDNTQYQIMRLMLLKNWNYAIIINLSDLSCGNSTDFAKVFDSISSRAHIDSIFHDKRINELNKLLEQYNKKKILVGWGSLSVQKEFMLKAINKLKRYKLIGISSNECENCYSHPSPLLKTKKVQWLEDINKLL